MSVKDFIRPALEVEDAAKEMIETKVDEVKLKMVKNLSSLFATFLSTFAVVAFFVVALAFLGVALAQWLGTFFATEALGFVMVAVAFLLISSIFLIFKKKLFIDRFIRKFISILFSDSDE